MKTLEIHFISDWHIGEGSGQPGHIDKLVRLYPQDGLPYVPAKTITGIWRSVCEQIAVALDDGNKNGAWQNWVTVLFGNQLNERQENKPDTYPTTAYLTIRSAHFPPALRKELLACSPLKEALTFIKPSTRIDRQTGQVIEKHLHFDEVVRTGAVLETQIAIQENLTVAQQQVAYALLWAGAKTVERLGGKRRRGLGHCRFKFDAISQEEALNILKQEPVPPCPERFSLAKARQFTWHDQAAPTDAWVQVPLYLTLKSPVLVPKNVLANVVTSRDYIPGTYLLGAITQLLQQRTQLDFFNDVAKGDIQISHAYLEVLEKRSLPVPMAVFHEKESNGLNNKNGRGGTVWNRLVECSDNASQLKQHRQGYISTFDEHAKDRTLLNLFSTPLQLTTHSTIEDKFQRPTEEVGGVFSYEAIKVGTRLQSMLKLRQSIANQLAAIDDNWWEILNADIHLGYSKKDDYGWVHLDAQACQPIPKYLIQPHDKRLTVWLCADLLLRDAHLRPSTNVADLQTELENQLAVKLTRPKNNDDTLSTLIRTTRTDGWHQDWRLPRPSYIGLAAGSCIAFECEQGRLDENKLQTLMQHGLGERRAEGFGEVRFNPPLLMQELSKLPCLKLEDFSLAKQLDESELSIPENTENFVKILEIAAWRKDIRQTAMALSVETETRHKTFSWTLEKPPNSQLGALRTVLTRMQTQTDKQQVQNWLNHLRKTDNRKDKWLDSALNTIESFLENQNLIWKQLSEVGQQNDLKLIFPTLRAEAKANLEQELWAEAVRALFAVAIRYEQRDRE